MYEGKTEKGDVEIPLLQARGGRRARCRVDISIRWLMGTDAVKNRAFDIGKESVVVGLDGICEFVVGEENMSIVDVERRQLVLAHDVYLLDVDLPITVFIRKVRNVDLFGEAVPG